MIKFSRGTGFKKYKAKVYLRGKLVINDMLNLEIKHL